jgi:hypothetical protein
MPELFVLSTRVSMMAVYRLSPRRVSRLGAGSQILFSEADLRSGFATDPNRKSGLPKVGIGE